MSKIRVLLVDDEEDYVKAMAERIEMRDLRSQIALSGEEALKILDEDPPDVIVLDLRMPGMQGMEVLERVRKEHPQMQVIILTGHGGDAEEREARGMGAFDFLRKPADTGELVDSIRGAWRRSLQVAKDFLRDSKDNFDRSMTAAVLAEGGMPDDASAMLAKKPRLPEPEAPASGLRVLLVDDEEDYVRTMAERMEMREVGSNVALTGEEALDRVKEDLPDVMVLDLKMPGMGGLEVLARVKKEHPQVQVIVLTGHGSDREEAEARRLGAYDYLTKPVDINDLMDSVHRAGRVRRDREKGEA